MEGLNFTKVPGDLIKCTTVLYLDYSDMLPIIHALIRALEYEELDSNQRGYIGDVIKSLLPSEEQFKLIQDSQLQGNPHEENKQLAMQIECLKNENERLVMNLDSVKETIEVLMGNIKTLDEIIELKDQTIKDMQDIIDILNNPCKAAADLKVLESSIQE